MDMLGSTWGGCNKPKKRGGRTFVNRDSHFLQRVNRDPELRTLRDVQAQKSVHCARQKRVLDSMPKRQREEILDAAKQWEVHDVLCGQRTAAIRLGAFDGEWYVAKEHIAVQRTTTCCDASHRGATGCLQP